MQPSGAGRKGGNLFPRAFLLFVVVLSPWPFGSVAPRAAATLTAVLLTFYGLYWANRLLRQRAVTLPPGWIWMVCGLALVAVQTIPLPAPLADFAAPAVGRAYEPLGNVLENGGERWHSLSLEPFRTEWGFLQLLGLGCAFHLANRLFRTRAERNLLACTIAGLGVALSLFAVYQNARFGTVLYGRVPVDSGTPFGPFVNHNHFAGYAEAAALVALGAAIGLSGRRSPLAFLLAGCAALIGIAHVLSHSRGGLLALASGIAALFWLTRRQEGALGLRTGGILAVCLFLAVFAPSSLSRRLATFGNPVNDDSIQFRLQLWSDSFGLWTSSPLLGTGLGTYAAAIPPHRTGPEEIRAEYAESDWLQLLCEMGIAGLAIAAVLLARTLGAAVRARDEPAHGLHAGAAAAVVALTLHGLVDFNFRIPSNALLFAVLLGVAAPAGATIASERRAMLARAAALALAGLTFGSTAWAMRLGFSDELNRRVNPLLARPEEFDTLIQELGASRARVPSNPDTSYLLGRLYNEEAYRSREETRYRELRLEQAREAFHESLRHGPARGRTWFELGWTEANLGQDAQADGLFARALELEPHWANLRANYALYLVSRGRIDEALAQIEAARELEPGLTPLDALSIVGPYVRHDAHLLRRAAGTGQEADLALESFGREGAGEKHVE